MADKFTQAMHKQHHHLDEVYAKQELGYDPTTLFGVNPEPMALGAPAGVKNGSVDIINYHPGYKDAPNYTVMHEMEHILSNRAEKRYGEEFGVGRAFSEAVLKMLGKDPRTAGTVGAYSDTEKPIRTNLAKDTVVDRFKKLGINDAYTTNYDRKRGINYSPLGEIFASLSGWEAAKGKDITQDPVIRKELFNDDPNLIEAYKAVTGLRQERLDAKDLAPYEPDLTKRKKTKSVKEKFVDLFSDPFKSTIK